MRHLLLTNDFPPKVGGIQSYLWELWRRLPADEVTVYTASSHPKGSEWDTKQAFNVVRAPERVLLPTPGVAARVRAQAALSGAQAVLVDPAFPLGLSGPALGLPFGVVLHGAEVTVPGRLPVSRQLLARAVSGSGLVVAAGTYPEAEARRAVGGRAGFPPVAQVPPGVDTERFRPVDKAERDRLRRYWGLPPDAPVVLSTSRLVPRKGIDTLIEAAALVVERGRSEAGRDAVAAQRKAALVVVVASSGRDLGRLRRLAAGLPVPVRFVGRVPEADLPGLYACADVFALCCRSRWWGLEQEGFGIVLLEAASAGLPCVALDTGGVAEAVADGVTGLVAEELGASIWPGASSPDRGAQVREVAGLLERLVVDPSLAGAMGKAGRERAQTAFSYDILAQRLADALEEWATRLRPRRTLG